MDLERIRASTTWVLAPPDMRPWLLMLWSTAWTQTPCGSLDANDDLIAAHIGMDIRVFTANREALMRGWYVASDGRLYHHVIAEIVERMRDGRRSDRERKQRQRSNVPPPSRVTPPDMTGTPPDSITGTGSGTGPGSGEIHQPTAGSSASKPQTTYKPPDCPHLKVLELWQEVLPALPQHDPEQWIGARADGLRARWRETAVLKQWPNADAGLLHMRRLFTYIGKSTYLTGQTHTPGRRPFIVELEWVVKPLNWAKIIEGKYHDAG